MIDKMIGFLLASIMAMAAMMCVAVAITVGADIAGNFVSKEDSKAKIERELLEDWARRGYGEFRMDKTTGKAEFYHFDSRYDLKR